MAQHLTYDVVPIFNYAFHRSIQVVKSVKKAAAERGDGTLAI